MVIERFIVKNKYKIAFINLVLILIAFLNHFTFKINYLTNILFIITSILGVIPIIISAYRSLLVKVVSIEVLVVIAVIGAFIIKNYEESSVVTFLFLFGSYLELKTLNKTKEEIKSLLELAPLEANKEISLGVFETVLIEEVNEGDVLLVKTGDKVPVDGVILSGEGYLNEASITGESKQRLKEINDHVYAGTILEDGTLKIKTLKVGEETTFGKIIELVMEATDSKSKTEKFIDKFSKYYTPFVLVLGFLVGIILKDIEIAVTILVLGCPGALVIGVPVSNVSGIGNGAKHGVLFKGSEIISNFSKSETIVFDKTGTLTKGEPEVSLFKFYSNNKEKSINYLVNIEKESNHPLAKAILKKFKETNYLEVTKREVKRGFGIKAFINNEEVLVGNENLLKEHNVNLTNEMINDLKQYKDLGNSVVILAVNKEIHLILGIKDLLKDDVLESLNLLRKLGIKKMHLLSGDNKETVNLIKEELKLDYAYYEMLPSDKSDYVKSLQEKGEKVIFVGDGVNDSIALKVADVGISMGSGTDASIDVSDVVLVNDNLFSVSHAYGLSKKMTINRNENIIIAIMVVIILLYGVIFSSWMNMSIGMLAHELSILAVIFNGMRLLKYKLKKKG